MKQVDKPGAGYKGDILLIPILLTTIEKDYRWSFTNLINNNFTYGSRITTFQTLGLL
jgi:hypothetical protein